MEFLHRFITTEKTRVHHYTHETKEQSRQWTEKSPSSKESKSDFVLQQGYGYCFFFVFFLDACVLIFINNLEKGKTINEEYYVALPQCLSEEIKEKRPCGEKKESVLSS